jgi:hypothetical protein
MICLESTRQILAGGITYPHFEQTVLSAAITFSKLILGFWGIFRPWHGTVPAISGDFKSPYIGFLPMLNGAQPGCTAHRGA